MFNNRLNLASILKKPTCDHPAVGLKMNIFLVSKRNPSKQKKLSKGGSRKISIFFYIEPQLSNFSKTPDRWPNPQFLIVQIFLRIGGDQLGWRLLSPNGQITKLEKFGEL